MDPLGRRFETGTPPYELLAGFNATFDYLDSIGGFAAIVPYERSLGQQFLDGTADAVTVYGLPGMEGRVPTFLVNVDGVAAADVAAASRRARDRACGPTTPGTRSTSTGGWATRSRRSGSASSTTTRLEEVDRLVRGWIGGRAVAARTGRARLSAGPYAGGRACSASNSSTSRLRASHSCGSWRWAISLPST